MSLILCVILVALVFEYVNGFNDTANSIATVVATKVLSPAQAVAMAAACNLIGALAGTAVASTIGQGLVDIAYVSSATILCGLVGAVMWNLTTWSFGLPSSSSHALIGGIVGSTLAAAHGDWRVVRFTETSVIPAMSDPVTQDLLPPAVIHKGGLLYKVVTPMFVSPVCGLVLGLLLMALLYYLLRHWRPLWVNRVFGKLQLASSAVMGFSHGLNDAQKTMGIITLSLMAATKAGAFDHVPGIMRFLHTPEPTPGQSLEIAIWVKVVCALTMAAGTMAGGWRIIKTLGHKIVRLQPVHGFAAETAAALTIQVASRWGMPLSTTHVVSSAIMGVGAAKRFTAVKWFIVERMVWAWILTIPVTASLGYLFVRASRLCGWLD